MPQLYALYEHATGFAIFRTTEFEEIAMFLPQVRQSITDISKFRSIVYLVAYQPFKNQKDALSNMKSIVSDELNMDLLLFLQNNIPKTKKSKQAVVLGVEEPSLATVISDKLEINCSTSGVVKEIIRGIRFHFQKLIKGFKELSNANKAELALAHHYSREKVNFDAKRQDCMIIESNTLIDGLNKDIRILTRRVRGWYSLHFPELGQIIKDNDELYVLCVQTISDRLNMPEDVEEKLKTVIEDSCKVEAILQAARISMGMEISPVDLEHMNILCGQVLSLIKKQKDCLKYLETKLNEIAPNTTAIVGEMVASRLISRAGGLTKLAKLPASTLQILGADKKLFRSVDGAQKFVAQGLISSSAFMGKAGKSKKGLLARVLANKCSLAARVDCFSRKTNQTFGSTLMKNVDDIIRLHKHFRNVNKKNGKQIITERKKEIKHKKSKKKQQNSAVIDDDSAVVNGSVNLVTEENLEEIKCSEIAQDEEMEVSEAVTLKDKTVESPIKSTPDSKKQKKRKSKANKSLIAEDVENKTSEMQANDTKEEKTVKRSKRLINRRSMAT